MAACIETLEEKEQKTMEAVVENAEEIGSVEIPAELSRALIELQENIRNKFIFNSLLVSAYSFFEYSFNLLCRYVDNTWSPEKSFDHTSNLRIDKCKKYLKDNIDIDFRTDPGMLEINTINKLRNRIVHNNSNIIIDKEKPIEQQKCYLLFNSNYKLDVTRTGIVFITNMDLIKDFIDKSVEFLEFVKNKISEQIKKDIESKKGI